MLGAINLAPHFSANNEKLLLSAARNLINIIEAGLRGPGE